MILKVPNVPLLDKERARNKLLELFPPEVEVGCRDLEGGEILKVDFENLGHLPRSTRASYFGTVDYSGEVR